MRVLVTGGTGKTGGAVARGLRDRGATPRIASRDPRGADQLRFDWTDPDSHESALRDVDAVYGGGWCTYAEAGRFSSYRRDGECGRMASLIWIE